MLGGGFLGVDLFFVLSGYLITSLLLSERRDKGHIELKRFWARRARRLLPALAGLLAGVAVYAAVFAEPNQLAQIRADGLATMLYVANWHAIFSNVGYWDLFSSPSPLEHMWSLAIEEQFYVIWPFVAFLVLRPGRRTDGSARRGPRSLFFVSAALVLASFVTMVSLAGPSTIERVYLGTDTRAAAILIGAALASWLAWKGPARSDRGRLAIIVAGWVGAAVLTVAWTFGNGRSLALYRGGLFLCGLSVAAVIAAVAHPRPGRLATVLSVSPLRFLGLISYGLYLWHWPVFLVLDRQRVGISGWPLFALQASVSIAIAVASYHLLERPIRAGALSGWGIRILMPATAGALVIALLVTTSGAPHTPTVLETVTAAHRSIDEAAGAEAAGNPTAGNPTAGNPATTPAAGTPRLMIAGDSIAFFLGQRLDQIQGDLGVISGSTALPGCRFTPGRSRFPDGRIVTDDDWPMCNLTWSDSITKLRPDVAYLMLNGPGNTDREVDGQWTRPCEPRFDDYLTAKLNDAIDILGSTGATVAIATAAERPSGDDLTRLGCFNQAIRDVAASRPRVRVIDVEGFVCPDHVCVEQVDGQVIRPDGVHFRGIGADYVLNWVVPQLAEIASHP
jgi:peptidoglycan/LPS O-acetylase OafA/YrhL